MNLLPKLRVKPRPSRAGMDVNVATKKILSLAARDDFVSAELSGDGDSVVLVMKFSKKSCEVCTFGRVVWR